MAVGTKDEPFFAPAVFREAGEEPNSKIRRLAAEWATCSLSGLMQPCLYEDGSGFRPGTSSLKDISAWRATSICQSTWCLQMTSVAQPVHGTRVQVAVQGLRKRFRFRGRRASIVQKHQATWGHLCFRSPKDMAWLEQKT